MALSIRSRMLLILWVVSIERGRYVLGPRRSCAMCTVQCVLRTGTNHTLAYITVGEH